MKVQCLLSTHSRHSADAKDATQQPSEQRTHDGPKAAHIATTGRGSFTSPSFRTSRAPRG